MYPLWHLCDQLCFTQCHDCLQHTTVFHYTKTHLLQTMVPVLICSYWPFQNKSQTKRHLFSVAGQVSTGSLFLVLFTLCWNTAASAQGPLSLRTTSLEELWWTQANSSTDLPFTSCSGESSHWVIRSLQMVYIVKTSKSVKMSHIFQVTIAILSNCFALHLAGHAGNNSV